jgi:hypothetical protein
MKSNLIERLVVSIFLLVILSGTYAYGQEDVFFTNVAPILEIGMGARPLGMGGAFVGLADDENAAFYNPAALAFLEKAGLTSLFSRQFNTFNYGSIGIVGRFLGLNLLQLDSGRIEITDQFGIPDGESFRYISQAGIGSFGASLDGVLAIGTRAKFFQVKLTKPVDEYGFGWTLDPAAMIKIEDLISDKMIKDFRIGILLENVLRSKINFNSGHSENWNPDLKIGLSTTLEIIPDVFLNILGDFNNLLNNSLSTHWGVELWANGLGVRAGLNNHGISMGTSIWLENIRIDWAYTTHYSKLPDNSRFSATLRF